MVYSENDLYRWFIVDLVVQLKNWMLPILSSAVICHHSSSFHYDFSRNLVATPGAGMI
jgi:hypothetical protein